MIVAKVNISGAAAKLVYADAITARMIGAEVEIEYDGKLWDSLSKTAVFQSGQVTKDVLNIGAYITIPPEVMREPGQAIRMGLYGIDVNNNVVVPTVWVELGKVRYSADPSGDSSTDSSLPAWAQLQKQVDDLVAQGGVKGDKGDPGEKGEPGEPGKDGADGAPGAKGEKGDPGEKGEQGIQGEKGEKGDKGDTGDTGPQGPKGDTGAQGEAGPAGPQGEKGEKGEKGDPGEPGADGAKGDKGDTGATGAAGKDGKDGSDGKSAYAYAQDAGYTGTEAAFSTKLAQEPLFGTTAKITPSQVRDAVIINRPIGITYTDSPFGAFHFTSFDANVSLNAVFASSILQYNGMYAVVELIGDFSADTWQLVIQQIPIMSDIPTALANPNFITFKPGKNAIFTDTFPITYSGETAVTVMIPTKTSHLENDSGFLTSAPVTSVNGQTGAVTITVPEAVTDEHINELIDEKLGVIENGSY